MLASMKKPTILCRVAVFTLVVLAVVFMSVRAMAQVVTTQPPPTITEAFVVTSVVALAIGFITQGLKNGNLLGFVKLQVPRARTGRR